MRERNCTETASALFSCPEEGCTKVYRSNHYLVSHLDSHQTTMGGEMLLSESKNTRDPQDLQYFYRQQLQQRASWLGPQGKEVQQTYGTGENFLLELFVVGEETECKVTPRDVLKRIRTLCR